MKKYAFPAVLLAFFLIETMALLLFALQDPSIPQDTIAVNEAVQTVQADWGHFDRHKNHTSLRYVVLDNRGNVLYRTGDGLSESIHAAVRHRDTILDLTTDGLPVGKLIIFCDSAAHFTVAKRTALFLMLTAMSVQCVLCAGYLLNIHRTILKPFDQLKAFAARIAGGNLDLPLSMDRQNFFGAFTESFDIMRAELKSARRAAAEAETEKKELVAKLSHDIRTPVASIRAAAELGTALADSSRIRDNYTQIIRKADQISTLVTELFTATLEELGQLPVRPSDIESTELAQLLGNADYLHRAQIPEIPHCLVYADRLRLQQVFDNLFSNSYKYAGTAITVTVHRNGNFLAVSIEDEGGGVSAEELPLLKEKFRRGANAKDTEGAGLGLYISCYFMEQMQGELIIENGAGGLLVTAEIALSGTF